MQFQRKFYTGSLMCTSFLSNRASWPIQRCNPHKETPSTLYDVKKDVHYQSDVGYSVLGHHFKVKNCKECVWFCNINYKKNCTYISYLHSASVCIVYYQNYLKMHLNISRRQFYVEADGCFSIMIKRGFKGLFG
jgi:hypothetical protein